MKSEKAKELIEKYAHGNSRNSAPTMLKKTCILCVELAEQEAEERIRRKAAEAYKVRCFHRDGDLCSISYDLDENGDYGTPQMCDKYCEYCGELEKFILKLYEE